MRRRLVLASVLALVCAKAFGAPVTSDVARSRADLSTFIPQGAITLTPTATLTAIPSPSASPTFTFTPQPGTGDGGATRVPTLSAGMLSLLAISLATVAILVIRRL